MDMINVPISEHEALLRRAAESVQFAKLWRDAAGVVTVTTEHVAELRGQLSVATEALAVANEGVAARQGLHARIVELEAALKKAHVEIADVVRGVEFCPATELAALRKDAERHRKHEAMDRSIGAKGWTYRKGFGVYRSLDGTTDGGLLYYSLGEAIDAASPEVEV